MSARMTGRTVSDETRKNLSAAATGRVLTPEEPPSEQKFLRVELELSSQMSTVLNCHRLWQQLMGWQF